MASKLLMFLHVHNLSNFVAILQLLHNLCLLRLYHPETLSPFPTLLHPFLYMPYMVYSNFVTLWYNTSTPHLHHLPFPFLRLQVNSTSGQKNDSSNIFRVNTFHSTIHMFTNFYTYPGMV